MPLYGDPHQKNIYWPVGQKSDYDYYTSVTGIPVNELTGEALLTGRPGDDYYGPPPKFYPPEKGYCLRCDMGMDDIECSCEEPRKPKFPPMERWSEGGFGRTFKGYSYLEGEEPESLIEDARRFIEWLGTREESVNKRLALYRRQRK